MKLHSDANDIRLNIFTWAKENKIPFSKIPDFQSFNDISSEINKMWASFDEEDDNIEFNIKIDTGIKRKYKKWIKRKLKI